LVSASPDDSRTEHRWQKLYAATEFSDLDRIGPGGGRVVVAKNMEKVLSCLFSAVITAVQGRRYTVGTHSSDLFHYGVRSFTHQNPQNHQEDYNYLPGT